MIPTKANARRAGPGAITLRNQSTINHSMVGRLIDRLDGVRQTGAGRWIARCPAHEDRRPSLSIRELDDGRVLMHDFAGCSVHEVLAAVGLEMSDLFPERTAHQGKPERRPFPAADALRAIAFEALIAAAGAAAAAAGEPISSLDRDRLVAVASRIRGALDACCPDIRRGRPC